MDIVIDIDGILTEEVWYRGLETYVTRTPDVRNIKALNKLYFQGHNLILFTARYEEDRERTVQWLEKHSVYYHKLILGKERASVYIDDRSLPYVESRLAYYLDYNFHHSCWRYAKSVVLESESHPCFFCGVSINLTTKDCQECGIMPCPSCGHCLCNIPLLTRITLVRVHDKYCRHLDRFKGNIELDGFVDNSLIKRCETVLSNCQLVDPILGEKVCQR
jgi:hypothetical protein